MKRISILVFVLLTVSSCMTKSKLADLKGVYVVSKYTIYGDSLEVVNFSDQDSIDYRLRLEFFESKDVSVSAPVNSCSGILRFNGKQNVTIKDMACTQMWGIDSIANVWESRYVDVLSEPNQYFVNDTTLELTGVSSNYLLQFTRVK